MRKPYTSFTIIGVLVSTFLITNHAHSRSSNQSTCSQALTNLEALDQKVRHETLLESIGLLLVMSKQTLRVRIEQLSQKELEMILPRIEAVSKRINAAQTNQETPPKIKNAITKELLARLKYISNRIKEVLRQYKTGERGGSTSVIPPLLMGFRSRISQAAWSSFCFGVTPPNAILGRSLL